jgi:hypothetical protein
MESKLKNLISIYQAARAVGMNPQSMRNFAIQNGLAIKWPGGKRFKVDLAEVEEKILQSRAAPERAPAPAPQRRRRRRFSVSELDPAVRC